MCTYAEDVYTIMTILSVILKHYKNYKLCANSGKQFMVVITELKDSLAISEEIFYQIL